MVGRQVPDREGAGTVRIPLRGERRPRSVNQGVTARRDEHLQISSEEALWTVHLGGYGHGSPQGLVVAAKVEP